MNSYVVFIERKRIAFCFLVRCDARDSHGDKQQRRRRGYYQYLFRLAAEAMLFRFFRIRFGLFIFAVIALGLVDIVKAVFNQIRIHLGFVFLQFFFDYIFKLFNRELK